MAIDFLLTMKWKVELDKKLNLVILTYNGLISTHELYESSSDTVALTNKYEVKKMLVEAKKYRTNSKRSAIFKMINELYDLWGLNRSMDIAIIEPKDVSAKIIAQFYELASRNLGWEVKVFPNRKNALNWLLEKQ